MRRMMLAGLVWMLWTANLQAQGTVLFYNHLVSAGIDAPVTNGLSGERIDGGLTPSARVQLYAGPVGSAASDLLPRGEPMGFLSGAGAGYIDIGTNGAVTVPFARAGTKEEVQVRAWTGEPTYEQALTTPGALAGKSAVLTVTLGGEPPGGPPLVPAMLTGMEGFAIEPASALQTPLLLLRYHGAAELEIEGPSNHTYQIQWADSLTGSNVWSPLTNLDLPGSVLDWTDQESTNDLERFYRALLVP